jgi:hypothetical protein
MPAASDGPTPVAPRTWRPLGTSLAGAFFFVMLLVVATFAWFGFSDEVRGQFTFLQKLTILAMGGAIGAVVYGFLRTRVTLSADGVKIVNVFRSHQHTWDEIDVVSMRSGAPWASLRLVDGSRTQVMALQGSDGERAQEGVRAIRAALADHASD